VTHDTRIGECDTCRARFKIPGTFRADRARCRECGGVVVLEVPRPVPRPPLERSRKVKTANPPGARRDEAKDERPAATTSARTEDRAPEPSKSGSQHVAHAPTQSGAKSPASRAEPTKSARVDEKRDGASAKDSKKSGGVLGSIVAAAKAAVWRKKRGK
jgi:hypothetical protein